MAFILYVYKWVWNFTMLRVKEAQDGSQVGDDILGGRNFLVRCQVDFFFFFASYGSFLDSNFLKLIMHLLDDFFFYLFVRFRVIFPPDIGENCTCWSLYSFWAESSYRNIHHSNYVLILQDTKIVRKGYCIVELLYNVHIKTKFL